jgi:hypothetical protein
MTVHILIGVVKWLNDHFIKCCLLVCTQAPSVSGCTRVNTQRVTDALLAVSGGEVEDFLRSKKAAPCTWWQEGSVTETCVPLRGAEASVCLSVCLVTHDSWAPEIWL